MPHFYQVTETDLRAMAREAASLFMSGQMPATDAAIKVASACPHALTSEHVQRVCEMLYHDIYERSFRDSPGPDRVVSFDPPDASKVASAVRAEQLHSFRDKIASSPTPGGPVDKTASAPARTPPPAPNAFLQSMSRFQPDRGHQVKEARHVLSRAREDLRESARALRTDIQSAIGSEKIAFVELSNCLLHAVRQGAAPVHAVTACVDFMKTATAGSEEMLCGVATDLLRSLSRAGVAVGGEKVASTADVVPNEKHPLRALTIKVAELREYRAHAEAALLDVEAQLARVERETRDALYQ